MGDDVNGPRGRDLWERADRALPGGAMYISRSADFAGRDTLPGFIERAEGARVTDVDGRTYIDFLCANGPNLLGYRHPEVQRAALAQHEAGDSMSLYPPVFVEFAERLLRWGEGFAQGDGFAWVAPGKNGSDVATLASRVARTATGRPLLVLFERAYHGFGEEYALRPEKVPTGVQEQVIRLPWNDVAALERCARERGERIAAVLLNPLDQCPLHPTEAASPEWVAAIARARDEQGLLVILDDIRHGFRIHPRGSHVAMGLEPDLLCLGKGIANGYATSALLGREPLRRAARRIPFTASYTFSSVACRAAITTLDIYERDGVFEVLQRAGERLRRGLLAAAHEAGHAISYTGPVTMPTLLFKGDSSLEKGRRFAREAALRGALFHPALNWFLCAAHDDATIDEAVAIAGQAFAATPVAP